QAAPTQELGGPAGAVMQGELVGLTDRLLHALSRCRGEEGEGRRPQPEREEPAPLRAGEVVVALAPRPPDDADLGPIEPQSFVEPGTLLLQRVGVGEEDARRAALHQKVPVLELRELAGR